MAGVDKSRPLTDKERGMLNEAIDVRVAQITRANSKEQNEEIRKLRVVVVREYETLRAHVNSSGVQLVIG